jgi:tRNA/tmRNA/rRNA uracil-C5-methylase (TrmA/RlmC/RlmD family)
MSRPIEDGPALSAVELDIEKLIGGGRGLAHHDGATWMVMGALPGEHVVAQPTRRRAGIIEAHALEVLNAPHPARLAQPCPHAESCGGCDWPHVDLAAAAALKAAAAAEAAARFPELAARIESAPLHTSGEGYRLRARLHWDPNLQKIGFYGHRSRTVSAIDSCRILSPRLMEALPVITQALARRCHEAVDVEWLEGTAPLERIAALCPAAGGVRKIDPSWVPTKDDAGSVVAGFHALSPAGDPLSGWGREVVEFELPIPLIAPIGAFFQGNRHLLGDLFDRVAELAGEEPAPVFDLHAGVGFLAAAALSASCRRLTLVEPNRRAARAAARNLPDALVVAGRTAEDFLSGSENLPRDALVITDPPRRGMSRALRNDLARWKPDRILMLGCDPATWARDAAHLVDHGYRVTELELFDLFPLTHHVEILAVLEHDD